jgi:hypothetical protein
MNTVVSSMPVAIGELSPALRIVSWVARVVAALILLQTLYFKFTGAPESVYIFETVGMEPWGRYGSGVGELIAALLLLAPSPALAAVGAAMSVGVISGALFFHLTKLGIVVQNDGGLLFALALVVFACGAFVLFVHRKALPVVGAWL